MELYILSQWSPFDKKYDYIKIGITEDLERRLPQLQTGNPHPIHEDFSIRGLSPRTARNYENLFKSAFSEWAVPNGGSEWFRFKKPSDEGRAKLKSTVEWLEAMHGEDCWRSSYGVIADL